jgi:hypothetical protein
MVLTLHLQIYQKRETMQSLALSSRAQPRYAQTPLLHQISVAESATSSPLLKYEEMLKNVDDPDGTHRHDVASATVVYLSSRMEAVRKSSSDFGGPLQPLMYFTFSS